MSLKSKQARTKSAERYECIAVGQACPDCGVSNDIESNGEQGLHLSYLCPGCGGQWDAHLYADLARQERELAAME